MSYILNLVYAVICFIPGGILTACGAAMLLSALAALCGIRRRIPARIPADIPCVQDHPGELYPDR